ncbi:hypothetical protein AJ78_07075 [Emergomyces pasteurianus Ep9510]|uniref:Uncharacterized protein n=1 Tax=Emergomyces pasteurianus Ep9510 TaxID=1447872 RepID=A0A1J9QAW0_9EURO|nr:hypothetical protein AJ78_07075 [Emergomyces pasteurianus Ep9510]
MSNYPPPGTPFKAVGFSEYCAFNGKEFRRKRGAQQWIESEALDSNLTSLDHALHLSLIQHKQAEGEPNHWSLFVARENEAGPVYQVTGDAECMSYQPSPVPTNIPSSESFLNAYDLAVVTDAQALIVKEVAENEPPPKAENRQAVVENCQGWTVRVIAKLVAKGIVGSAKLEMARSMVEPI